MTRLRHALDFVLGSDGVELATGPEVIRCDKAERELCTGCKRLIQGQNFKTKEPHPVNS